MPLEPQNMWHAAQIIAGTSGRHRGHIFERQLAESLNDIDIDDVIQAGPPSGHLATGSVAFELLRYVFARKELEHVLEVHASWLGGLATSGEGDTLIDQTGEVISKSKSDIFIRIDCAGGAVNAGISVKSCRHNDQIYFTTAIAFCSLLRTNGIDISESAESALRMFCGDPGFRPVDICGSNTERRSDPHRWFWEELPAGGREEWEAIIETYQTEISALLLQRAYPNDPFPPEFLLHRCCDTSGLSGCTMAIYTISELVDLSCNYGGFSTREYMIRKGRYRGDPNAHSAPRFGFIQFQRAGNRQHPTQLQFNLKAGYYNAATSE